jgi:hypothetical protein
MKIRLGLFCVALFMLLAACTGPGPYAVVQAEVTDIITNTEARSNGTFMIWVRTDTTSAYCTLDRSIYEQARLYRQQITPITIEYKTINRGDADYGVTHLDGTNNGGCDPEGAGIRTYQLIQFYEAGGATTPR